MKRLVWIFLAAFCTLLAQVPTVSLPLSGHGDACGCCEGQGACGMPDCAPAPQTTPSTVAFATSRQVQIETRRTTRAEAGKAVPFYLTFVSSPAREPAARAVATAAPAAPTPLFKAHCSYLI